MFGVNRQSNEEICRGCLSTERRLAPLAYCHLFVSLLNEKQKLEVLKYPTMHLCWECNALLRKMRMFQMQTQHAHRLLEELANELPSKGLSQLTTCYKQDYDVIIEDDFDDIEELVPVKEETKIQTNVMDHSISDDDNFFEETEYLESPAELDLFEESTENNLIETVPRNKCKRKLKRVKTYLQTKKKKKRIEASTVNKGNRKGLRSSAENVPSLYGNKNNDYKKEVKTEIKVNNTIRRNFKPLKQKKCSNRTDLKNTVKEKKEDQTPCVKDTAAKDLQNMVTDVKTEVNKDKELENLDVKNTKEKINDTKQDNHDEIDESDSENDDCDNNDPDYEEEVNKHSNKSNKPNKSVNLKKEGVSRKDKWLLGTIVRFDEISELDIYFTKLDLSPEEIKDILDNELSYETEEQPHGCNFCGFSFKMSKTLMVHKSSRHKQIASCPNPVYLMYRCNICNKIIRKEHAEAHMKYLHRWRYYCKECDKNFWNREEGRSHFIEDHRNPNGYNCNHCSHFTVTRKGMESHIRNTHTRVACDVCDKTFCSLEYMRIHRQRHEVDGNAPEQRYCVQCDKQYPTVFTYKVHLKKSAVHNEKVRDQVKIPCTDCGRLMKDKRSLQLHHDRFHRGKTSFQCPHCNQYYARKNGLEKHIEFVHLKKRLPKDKLCSICGRGFASVRTLRHHIRTHTGERPHVCPHCPAAFAQPFPLRKHRATQHGETLATQKKVPPTTLNKEAPISPTLQE